MKACTALLLFGLVVGCGDDSTSEPAPSDVATDTAPAADVVTDTQTSGDTGVDVAPGLACVDGFDAGLTVPLISFETVEDGRYCEVLIINLQEDGSPLADVYNSMAFGKCPQDLWDALDADTIKKDFPDAMMVMLNGPRYFLMQDLFDAPNLGQTPQVHDFGGIKMTKMATVAPDMGALAAQSGYQAVTVNRDNTWRFREGVRVHELVDPEGNVYVMQSFARIVDEDLAYEDLETLGERLSPPDGWSYRARVLDAHLDVQADGTATVVQDELKNTYQWRSDCQIEP